jgi:anti-sigma factor ChrR (cupin superfamily)
MSATSDKPARDEAGDVLTPPKSLWTDLAKRIGADTGRALPSEPAEMALPTWEDVAPGISCQLLSTDEVHHRVSMLVRLAPGASYPPHVHAGIEELHLLDGELWIEDRKLLPGDYNRGEPGTGDQRVFSETGCTCILITSTRDSLRG